MTEYGNTSVKVWLVWRLDLSHGAKVIVELFTSKLSAEAFAFRQWASESTPCRYEVEEKIALSH